MTDKNISYVRTEMLGEQDPPLTQVGIFKWMRENLFSSWINIALTLISLYVIWVALSGLIPWVFGGVGTAGSLSECREVFFAFYKGSHDVACWAVIADRWQQLLFGFYPPELYWRPVLTFVLFFVALAPILFREKVPGFLIYFSMIYPFLATWLIWGGSIWAPLFTALGFVIGWIAFRVLASTNLILASIGAVVAALAWWFVVQGPLTETLHKAVGTARIESTIAESEARIEELRPQVETTEEALEDVQAEVAAAVGAKDAILAEMSAIRAEEFAVQEQIDVMDTAVQRLEAAADTMDLLTKAYADADEAAIEEHIGDIVGLLEGSVSDIESVPGTPMDFASNLVPQASAEDSSIIADAEALATKASLTDPITAVLSGATEISQNDLGDVAARIETARVTLQDNIDGLQGILDKVIATNADDLAGPQDTLLAQMDSLQALRGQQAELSQEAFRTDSEISDSQALITTLESLNEREALVPVLEAQLEEIGSGLTWGQRRMISANQLPEDAEPEVRTAVSSYIETKNSLASLKSGIAETYGIVGRIGLEPIESRQIGGFLLAIIIGLAGIGFSLPLGILLALGRQSHLFVINKVCVTFIEVIRGVPLIVWLFTASILLNYFLPPGTTFDLMLRVIIMVTLFASAYIAEVIRGGLAALPKGQYEGADSLGLSYWQSMRLIVLPQALKISIPGIVNTFIGLFKDTTLVLFIGLLDPLGLSNAIRADTDWNGIYWELFVFIGAIFFIFCFSMGRYSLYLEKKLQREHR